MKTVSKYINKLLHFFEFNETQVFQISVPYQQHKFLTTFERQNSRDLRGEFESTITFPYSRIIGKIYSDETPKIIYIVNNFIPRLKTIFSISFEEHFPISIKTSYFTTFNKYTFKENFYFTTGTSNDQFRRIFHSSTTIFNNKYSIRFETFHGLNLILVETFLHHPINIGFNSIYNWKDKRISDSRFFSNFHIKNIEIIPIFSYLDRSIEFVMKHQIQDKLQYGILVGFENIGYETDFNSVIGIKYQHNDRTNFKFIGNNQKKISLEIRMKYQEILSMKFMSSFDFKEFESKYGANIIFELKRS